MAIRRIRRNKDGKISLEKVVYTSFLTNIIDVVFNIIVAYFTGSITVLSIGLESLADLLSSAFLLIGALLSKRPADKQHAFGYGREIYFWALLSGLITFTVAASLSFYWGFLRVLHPAEIENLTLTYVTLFIGVLTNGYAFSLSYRRLAGRKKFARLWQTFIHSALIETKTAFVLDLMGTTAAFTGLTSLVLYGLTGFSFFDGIGAMMTGVLLAFFAFFILKGAKELLVGQSADEETIEKITKATLSFHEVKKILDLRTILLGTEKLLVSMEVHLEDKLTTDEIEKLVDDIEEKITKHVPTASHIHIELETPDV